MSLHLTEWENQKVLFVLKKHHLYSLKSKSDLGFPSQIYCFLRILYK